MKVKLKVENKSKGLLVKIEANMQKLENKKLDT